MQCQVIESKLNHMSLEELEIMIPDHAIPDLPIGMSYRNDRDVYVVRDVNIKIYYGPNLHKAIFKLIEYNLESA